MEAIYLTGLYWFAFIFIIGILLSCIASRLKLPEVLLLIMLGAIFGMSGILDINVIPGSILTGFAVFALIMIIFSSTSEFNLKEVGKLSPYAVKLAMIFLALCVIILGIATFFLFNFKFSWSAVLMSLLFSSLMVGTAPDIILSTLGKIKNKIVELLEFESIINTPLTVIIPLIVLDIYNGLLRLNFVSQFLGQIMTGVGTGMVIGLIVFRLLDKESFRALAPLLVIGVAVSTYALSEFLRGNGVLAVTTLGIVFGKMQIKQKIELEKFVDLFTNLLKIIVFIVLGLLIRFPLTAEFIGKSFVLFIVYLGIRYFAVKISFKDGIDLKEKLFMTLNVPKGIAVAVVAFILVTYVSGFEVILNLVYIFIVYSVVLSSIMGWVAPRFIDLSDHKMSIKKKEKKIEK